MSGIIVGVDGPATPSGPWVGHARAAIRHVPLTAHLHEAIRVTSLMPDQIESAAGSAPPRPGVPQCSRFPRRAARPPDTTVM